MRLFPYASSAKKISAMDTSSNISAIFERNLPSVDKEKKSIFIEKMLAYHNEFKRHRDNEMNYEENAEYQNEHSTLSIVDQNDYWIYSPQFKKTLALIIGELFKTKITEVSFGTPVTVTQDLVLFDGHLNRWTMSFQSRESEPEKLHIVIRFPRSKSRTKRTELVDEKTVSDLPPDTYVNVIDTSQWHDA